MAANTARQRQRPAGVSEVTVTVSAGDDRLCAIRAAAALAGISPLLDTGAPSRRGRLFVLSAELTAQWQCAALRAGACRDRGVADRAGASRYRPVGRASRPAGADTRLPNRQV